MAVNQSLQQKKPNQTATGYTNIQRILQANKANQLGSTVAGGVQKAGQAATGAINQAGQQFKSEAEKEKERLAAEQQRVTRVLGDVSKASDEDISAFEGIRGGKSKGPTGIQNADELRSKALEAERLGTASGSEAGRYGLLQRYVGGNKQYTGGQQRLDSMLLGQTGAGQLRSAKQGTLGLSNKVATQETGAQETGKLLQNQAKNLADTTISSLGGQVVDYDTAMERARIKAQEDLAAKQAAQKAQLEAGEITDEDLYGSLGINEGDQIWRTNLADYYQALNNVATKQNVQTQEDFNRINALQRLSGNSLTGQASSVLPTYSDRSQIDAFKNMDTFKYDQDALAGKLASEKGLYQGAIAPHESNIQGIDRFLNTTGGGWRGYTEAFYQSTADTANQLENKLKNYNIDDLLSLYPNYPGYIELKNAQNLLNQYRSGQLSHRDFAEQLAPKIGQLNTIFNPGNDMSNAGTLNLSSDIQGFLGTLKQQEAARKAEEAAIGQKKDVHQFARTLKRTPTI